MGDTNRMEKQQDVMIEKRQRDVMMEKQNGVMIESLLQSIEVTSEDVISHDGPVFSDSFPEIDMKTAKWIDRQLDWQDAVSFSFLMVEKVEIALKLSRAIEHHKRNIFQDDGNDIGIVQVINLSAEKNRALHWQIRVYQKFNDGCHIKPERRLIFKLCQELEMKDQAEVTEYMKRQLGSVPPLLMMESLFLHMMSISNTESLCTFVLACLREMRNVGR